MITVGMRLTMLSDWHAGTGTGRRGFADNLVNRDARGLPFIPAKTVTGVWRDACEVAAHALDGGPAGPWHAWAEHLFGSQPALSPAGTAPAGEGRPREAALSVRSLHYPAEVSAVLAARPRLAAAVTFLKPGVHVDRVTGRAADKLLRFDEMARAGAVLTGTAQIAGYRDLDEDQQRSAATLLAIGARLVEGIGGRRRRGSGWCLLELDGIAADLAWLQALDVPPLPPAQPVPADGPYALPASPAAADAWEIADLRLELVTPVIAHERTVGNTVRSADYVPGSTLLPQVLQRLGVAAAGHRDTIAVAARAGELIVTNATIEVAGRPGQPVPRFLARHKGTEPGRRDLLCNLAAQPRPRWFHPEPVEEGYLAPAGDGGRPEIQAVARVEQAHNTIDDSVQKPTEAVGGLYSYQAISPGTVLRAEVRAPAGLLRPGWQTRLDGSWRLGRSSKDEYGLVSVRATARTAQAVPAATPAVGAGRSMRVWLLSDLLVTDERLRPSSDPADIGRVLGAALGVGPLRPVGNQDGAPVSARTCDRRTESWHRRWGLPRPTLTGMAAGSCLTFAVEGPAPGTAAIRRVELTGIGQRRGEGFGQVRIDDPLLVAVFDLDDPGPAPAGSAGPASVPAADPPVADGPGLAGLPSPAAAALRVIEEAAWRQAIRERSESKAATSAGRQEVLGQDYASVPSSQLFALRMITATLGGGPDPRAGYWLSQLAASKGREHSWPGTVVARLTRLLTDPQAVWQVLAIPEAELAGSPAAAGELRERLWPLAVRALVTACLTSYGRGREEDGDA